MIRLIGILTGSAIAVAILIVALGLPKFAAPEAPTPAITEPLKKVAYEPPPEPEAAAPVIAEIELEDRPLPETVATTAPEPLPEDDVVPPQDEIESLPEPVDQHWYAFWSPFRSEIAANGFVSQLQRNTGLDYRVVKLKPGVYEVAVAYSDDSDIQEKLTQISSATGLDLSGG